MTFTPILTSIIRLKLLLVFLAAISFTIAPNGVRADDYAYAVHQCRQTWECDYSPKTRCCARYCDLTACTQTTRIDISATNCSPQLNAYLVCMKEQKPTKKATRPPKKATCPPGTKESSHNRSRCYVISTLSPYGKTNCSGQYAGFELTSGGRCAQYKNKR